MLVHVPGCVDAVAGHQLHPRGCEPPADGLLQRQGPLHLPGESRVLRLCQLIQGVPQKVILCFDALCVEM